MGGNTEDNTTEVEKGPYIKENSALLQLRAIESTKPERIVHPGKVLFQKEGSGEFALYSLTAVIVAEDRSHYRVIFKDVSNNQDFGGAIENVNRVGIGTNLCQWKVTPRP